MKIITAFLLALAATVAVPSAYAETCQPITHTACTATAISAENCHDGSVHDSRGAWYGPKTFPDGTVSCDSWHGEGDEYKYKASVASQAESTSMYPEALDTSTLCVIKHYTGGYSVTCGVRVTAPVLVDAVILSCSVVINNAGQVVDTACVVETDG